MGTSHSAGELAEKLSRAAAQYANLDRVTVEEASLITKRTISAIAPSRLRGVGKRGAKLSVRYNIGTFEGEAKSLVFAVGPWQLIERDTKAHSIPRLAGSRPSKKTGLTRLAGPAFGGISTSPGKPLAIPGLANAKGRPVLPEHVRHPGTKGKHPWEKGVIAAEPLIRRAFDARAVLPIRRIF